MGTVAYGFQPREFTDVINVSDVSAGGSIGAAGVTVDLLRPIRVNQTTASKVLTLAAPTRGLPMLQPVENVGTAGFWMYGRFIRPGGCHIFIYDAIVGAWRSTSSSPQIVGQSAVAVTAPGDTNENTLASITLPASVLGANGAILIRAGFSFTVSANAKTLRARLGTTEMARFGPGSTSGSLDVIWGITNQNSESAQTGMPQSGSGTGATANAYFTGAENTAAASTIYITGTKASAGETLKLERYSIEIRRFD